MAIYPRTLYPAIKAHVAQSTFTIITGARQVGKTTLLRQLYRELTNARETVYLFSLEDPIVLERINAHPYEIFNLMEQLPERNVTPTDARPVFLLLDEIQYADDPSNFLKLLYDTYAPNLKIVATGSSAFYINDKFKDSLAGRKRIFHLRTLSFTEFLIFRQAEQLLQAMLTKQQRPDYVLPQPELLQRYFFEYLRFGGYPKVVLTTDEVEKRFVLNELLTAYLRRDMLEAGIEKSDKFLALFRLLANQVGDLVNKNELANTLRIDNKTVGNYLRILRQCFHIDLLRPLARNLRKELTKMPKVYFQDLGLRNVLLGNLYPIAERNDRGELLENFYYRHLTADPLAQLYFWRTTGGREVDFVLETAYRQGSAYEIKWDAKRFSLSRYKLFTEAYPEFPLTPLSATDVWRIA